LTVRRPILPTLFILTVVCAVAVVAASVALRLKETDALFTRQQPVNANLAAARIFAGERVTPAFSVSDRSSGSATDGSSANAFANDSRYFLTRAWSTAFASDRYLDFDLNGPLPTGLTAQSVTATIRVSSDLGAGSVCAYVELRRASTNVVLSTHGSAGTPLACTSGTTVTTLSMTLTAVSSTDVANDVRLRLFLMDTASGAARVDEATVAGQTPYSSWTLYPVQTRESYSGQVEVRRWGLAGP
jgi:hypothetical protein